MSHAQLFIFMLCMAWPLVEAWRQSAARRALRAMPQVTRLRIHTRLPIVLPERIDAEFLGWIGALPWPVVMVVHANHANEIDGSVREACAALRQRGVCGARTARGMLVPRGRDIPAATQCPCCQARQT